MTGRLARTFASLCIAALAVGGACGDTCDVACTAPSADAPPPTVLVGKVVGRSGHEVRVEADGASVDVRVHGGHARSLDTGSTYRFPVAGGDESSQMLSARLPSDCDCGGPYITEPDGSAVDQSVLGFSLSLASLQRLALWVLGGLVVVGLIWGGARRVRPD